MEWPRTLTVGGLIGTGTTTACRTLEQESQLRYVYAGQIFRDLATKNRMSLEQFGAYAEQHPKIDRDLDDQQVQILRGPPVILEGRLSGYLAMRERLPAFKCWFTCDPYVRARRYVEREGGEVEPSMAKMRRREDSERRRYLEFYGFDINDLSLYDLVLDTTNLSRREVVDAVIDAYKKANTKKVWWKLGFA